MSFEFVMSNWYPVIGITALAVILLLIIEWFVTRQLKEKKE